VRQDPELVHRDEELDAAKAPIAKISEWAKLMNSRTP
jgi:hypothetical protein